MTRIEVFQHARDSVAFKAGEPIFEAGQVGDSMYAVIEGEVEILANGSVIETTGAGGIVGEMALIDRAPRSASARARTDCRLVAVDAKRFEYMVQQTPFFALQVMRIMAERLRRWTEPPRPEPG